MIPKPAKGAAAKARRAARAKIERAERLAKMNAIIRDLGRCRRCNASWPFAINEVAHLVDKGMGGDHGLRSSSPSDYVTLCADCHRGPRSVHSGHVRIVCLTDQRGDGPVRFEEVHL